VQTHWLGLNKYSVLACGWVAELGESPKHVLIASKGEID
jgi:hypothetical protein